VYIGYVGLDCGHGTPLSPSQRLLLLASAQPFSLIKLNKKKDCNEKVKNNRKKKRRQLSSRLGWLPPPPLCVRSIIDQKE